MVNRFCILVVGSASMVQYTTEPGNNCIDLLNKHGGSIHQIIEINCFSSQPLLKNTPVFQPQLVRVF